MSLLRADKITNRFNNSGPIIVGPSTVSGNFTVTGILTALGIGVTNDVLVGGGLTTKFLTATNSASLFNSSLTGITTAGIITNATYFGDGVNLTGIVTEVQSGSGILVTPPSGKGKVTVSVTSAPLADYADNAGIATDIKGGAAGAVLYQAGLNDTGFTAVGNNLQILQSTGNGSPIWVDPVATVVSFASSSGITSNLSGGSAGRIPIQTAPDTTTFLPIGPAGKLLLGQGTNLPIWIDPKATLDVRYARLSGISTSVIGGIASVTQLNVSGITSTQTLEVAGLGSISQLNVSGTANIGDANVTGTTTLATLGVTGLTTTNDLVVSGITSLSETLFVSGITTLASDGGITTTGGDLYVGGDLQVDQIDSNNLNITGIATINQLGVTGLATTKDLLVTGISTFAGFSTFISGVYVSGIASVGAAITMYPTTGIVSATSFYGDGANLTNVVGLVSVTNQIYVTPDGDDENDGYLLSTAKRTVGSAVTIAQASTVIRISAGNYQENNPIILPEQVTLLGDSLREVSIIPQNRDKDLIYVANGSYVENMTFTGTLDEGKAIIAFNPEKPSYVTQGPYIRNCTNFISNSIGMKIDGNHVLGPTRAMNVDSYTQLNQGGIGVSVSNEGYAQLVSIFTIYNDQSIVCINGGQCDLTNSNSSFGRLGLVADGIGPQNFIGTVSEFVSADTNQFPINLGVDSINVTNATYDNVTGLTTITTATDHGFNVGMSVSMRNLKFSCDSKDVVREVSVTQQIPFNVSNADYTESTGIMTVTTGTNHNFNRRSTIDLSQLVFQCNSGGGLSTAFFPPGGGDGNGPTTSRFIVDEIPANNQFVVDVGISTITHSYVEGGTSTLRPSLFGVSTATYTASTGIMTVTTNSDHNLTYKSAVNLNNLVFRCNSGGGFSTALFPPAAGDGNGATTSRFSVQEIPDDNVFVVNVGISTIDHEFVEGGTATNTPYYGVTNAIYNSTTGIMTVSTDVEHNIVTGISVTMTNLVFQCNSGGGFSTAFFPPAAGDGNGLPNHVFDVISVGPKDITVNVGPSTISHTYIDSGQVAISTIASFPNGSFGNIFTVTDIASPTEFNSYVGVSTYPSLYHSGGQVETFITRPFDGQVVYLDSIYNSIKDVTITNGGSGYTTPPKVTFSNPSESWGIKATAVAILTGDKVTDIDMISNGRGYTGTPTVTFEGSATGDPEILPTYYVVSSSTPIVSGITTVTFTDNVPYAVGVGTTVPFFKQSRVLASSQAFEYIGSGNTALTALPQRGGIAIPENEIVNKNGGLVIFTSTDQAGNFKIGEGVIINQLEGSITGDAYNRSLFASITPYILALGGD